MSERSLRGKVAVVGVGETDYGLDYRGARGEAVEKGTARYDSYTLASRALKRALDDMRQRLLYERAALSVEQMLAHPPLLVAAPGEPLWLHEECKDNYRP